MAHTLPFVFEARLIARGYRIHRTLKTFVRLSCVDQKGSFDLRIDSFPNRRLAKREKDDFRVEQTDSIPWWESHGLELGIVEIILKNTFDLNYPHTLFVNEKGRRVSAEIVKLLQRA